MKKNLQYILVVVVLIGIIVVLLLVTGNDPVKEDPETNSVHPFITDIISKKIISGNLYPIKEISVNSAISGVLDSYFVEIGDRVRRGDDIAKVRLLTDPAQLERAKSTLKTAEITFENDRINYERDEQLYEEGVISKIELEQSSRQYLISKEQYESAGNQLRLLEEGSIPSSNISNIVSAVIDGTVTDLPLEIGAPVVERNNFREGSVIAVISRVDTFLFKSKVVESDVISMHKGMHITISPLSFSNVKANGTVRKISTRGQLDNGLMKYNIEAVLALPDSIPVYSGFNATADIVLERADSVLAIEEEYLQFENDSAFVEIYINDKDTEKRYVEIGISDGISIQIVSGLEEDDVLVER